MGTLEIEEFEGGEAERCDGPIRRRGCGQENRALSLAHSGPIDFGMQSPTRESRGETVSLMNPLEGSMAWSGQAQECRGGLTKTGPHQRA